MGLHRAWQDYAAILTVSAVLLPVLAGLAFWGLVRRRGSIRRSAAEVALVAGTVPWLAMAFTPQPAPSSVSLVPFHDLPSWWQADAGTTAAQLVGNLLVLAAFGFCLPIRFPLSWWQVAGLALITSIGIEVSQYALDIGRVSSVDDVLTNTLGAGLAAVLSRPWWSKRTRLVPPALGSASAGHLVDGAVPTSSGGPPTAVSVRTSSSGTNTTTAT
jgi:hypothetical protein